MSQESAQTVKLTAYSHGAGCGCKISPKVLSEILGEHKPFQDANLLVGNDTRDDAAVYALNNEEVVISTTDFFMPIVDDPFDFGAIASVNAISDIYAMGGQPLMAIAILGWPIDKLPAAIAGEVLNGARDACQRAGIALAGGHSIDAPEPIFGLAVTGRAKRTEIRTNDAATQGCQLYLTKPIGVGILTTAQKKGILEAADFEQARSLMLRLNDIGPKLAVLQGVRAITDVTGFGLLGHLVEMAEGSKLTAHISSSQVPRIKGLEKYLAQKSYPGGTSRNFDSYGHKVASLTQEQKLLLCDPQTSGGLLVAVEPSAVSAFQSICQEQGLQLEAFGEMRAPSEKWVVVS